MSLLVVIVISTFTSGEILDKKKSLGEKSNSEVKIQEQTYQHGELISFLKNDIFSLSL